MLALHQKRCSWDRYCQWLDGCVISEVGVMALQTKQPGSSGARRIRPAKHAGGSC